MSLAEIFSHHIIDHTYATINFFGLALPITRHLLMMWISALLLIVGIPLILRGKSHGMRLAQGALESVVGYIRDEIVVDNMGEDAAHFTPYFCTLFFFILVCNLMGLVPYGATATGNIAVTGGLALTTFALINFMGIRRLGLGHYISSFIPSGVPKWLYPMMFPIEVISLFSKTFALCIRLFANMIAGHFVILSLIGLIFIFGGINVYAAYFITIPADIPMLLFVSLLEVFTAFLQAYIFTFLTAIFTGAAMHPH